MQKATLEGKVKKYMNKSAHGTGQDQDLLINGRNTSPNLIFLKLQLRLLKGGPQEHPLGCSYRNDFL